MIPSPVLKESVELTDASTSDALLNILEDAQAERDQLHETQRALVNILEDSGAERDMLARTQSAMLNILDDAGLEKIKSESAVRDLAREMRERELVERSLEEALATTDEANRALEQANNQLESFSYSVAHDLRGPLRAVNGFTQILLEDHAQALDDEGLRVLHVIVKNVARMGSLIDGLLALSRLGRAALEPQVVDMSELVRVAISDLADADGGTSTEFIVSPLEPAQGDPVLIAQVWANLLSNGSKFTGNTPGGRVVVSSERHGDEVTYAVADNGAGFDNRYVDKLFGVFQRLHSVDEFDGTGIGLAITARIIERHGGRIWADGAVGEGATFSFTLPATGGAA